MPNSFKISKEETTFIKGVGIFFIILHNYFHWVPPFIGENEFKFKKAYFLNLLSELEIDYWGIINHLSSYFGHYFVQVFIFLSGYGLAVKFSEENISYKNFFLNRVKKIYPILIICVFVAIFYNHYVRGYNLSPKTLLSVIARFSIIVNWIPERAKMISGPYWFFSMIFQLYLLFPLLVNLKNKATAYLSLTVLCYALICLFEPYFVSLDSSLYYNFVGNLPVFLLGIFMREVKNSILFSKMLFFASIVLFIVGQYNLYFWYISQVTFTIFCIPILLQVYRRFKKTKFIACFNFLGIISFYLFVLNGFLRAPWVIFSIDSKNKFMPYLYFLIYLGIIILISLFLKKIDFLIQKRIKPSQTNLAR